MGPLRFLVYVNDIWRNIDSSINIIAKDCIIYRKITNKNVVVKLQKDLDTLGEWEVENGMKINPGKCKTIRFTTAPFKSPQSYSIREQKFPEKSSCKYLGVIIRRNLNWLDQLNYIAQKSWKIFHFVMRVLKEGNCNSKHLAYMSLVGPLLEYGAACWDPCRERQINEEDRVQLKVAQFSNHTKDSDWETLAQRRMIARLCALFKAYSGEKLG